MGDWFTVGKIDNATYSISEYGHPQEVHSFLLIGEQSAGLIDTGLGIYNIKEITDRLTNLPVKVITTHAHFDHIGSHGSFPEIYIHKNESGWLRKGLPIPLQKIRSFVMEEPITKPLPENFTIKSYFPYQSDNINELKDNEMIDLGGRELRIVHTPGHSPGHICIVDKSRGYLFTGDLIYKGPLYAHLPESDLELYRDSIRRVSELKDINSILPSHNDLSVHGGFIEEVLNAFNYLEKENRLKKGQGKFQYKGITILL